MPLSDLDRNIARELKRRISSVTRLVDFKVFGSRARGDAEPDSDLDVFIELESGDKNVEDQIRDIAWEIGFHNGCIHISPLIFTRQEIEESPMRASAIVRSITEEGVRI